MQTLRGYVSAIIYRNKENLYTVFEVTEGGRQITCTGFPSVIAEGDSVIVSGEIVRHPVYGDQLRASSVQIAEPEGTQAVLRYLSSGAVRGVGEALAARIVRKFGDDTMRILDEEPQRLSEVRGISEAGARAIAAQLAERKDTRDAMIFLQQYGLSGRKALKIWEIYGAELYTVLKENPYRLADDVEGIGFATADDIACRAGIQPDSDFRIRSGLLYLLNEALQEGSTYLPEEQLTGKAVELLQVPAETVGLQLQNLAMDRKVRIIVPPGADAAAEEGGTAWEIPSPDTEADGRPSCFQPQVYSAAAFRLEQDIARRLLMLNADPVSIFTEEEILLRIRHIEESEDIHLDELQREAVHLAVTRGIVLISGGPGTGKTTTINAIIRFFLSDARTVLLAAPTGRAARRMTEATGHEAMTIHRLLGYHAPAGEESGGTPQIRESGWVFDRNEENPLDAEAVIIDEMSMVDLWLFRSLLAAVRPGTRLILVGDRNQLPSVGPGRVFGDLMDCGRFPSIVLKKIFRQAKESGIVVNAHRLLAGEPLDLGNHSKDFFFLERSDPQVIYKHMVLLIRDRLPHYVDAGWEDIQVLTPMRKGPLGAVRLNEVLQSVLNPPAEGKAEYRAHDVTFRTGDKVMQMRNHYQIEWEVPGRSGLPADTGVGIFNGDFGVILEIDRELAQMTVRFDENRIVQYPFAELENLDLAYAITVHKSQGSEYPAVILPILSGPQTLLSRNLLYTAITRARRCAVILGSSQTLMRMENNVRQNERYTGLADRVLEMEALT